jgi:dolichol-phosphate mannosyltransferase
MRRESMHPAAMFQGRRVGVIVPAYNEQQLILETLRGIPPYVDRIIVVDDASQDATRSVVASLDDARITLLCHPHNRGVGAAIVSGYQQGIAQQLDVMVVMAGDNQMCPSDLPTLLQAVCAGADYAKGNRFQHPARGEMPRLRRLGGRWLSFCTRLASGLVVGDCQCGYTALSTECAKRLPLDELWPRYGYPNDLLLMLAAHQRKVVEVLVRPVYGTEQSGVHPGHALSIACRIVTRHRKHLRLARNAPTGAASQTGEHCPDDSGAALTCYSTTQA